MIATEKFTAGAVLEEVRRLYESRQTGVLVLDDARGERITLSFREGRIDAASSNKGTPRLSDYIVKGGLVTAAELDAVQSDSQKQNMVLGEAIVRKKLLIHGDVGEAARRQCLDLVEHMLDGGFKVSSFTNSLCSYYVPAGITFPHLLLELSRNNHNLFDPAPGVKIGLVPETDPSAFPWSPAELFVLSELQVPKTFDRLLAATGFKEGALKTVLGIMERVGLLRSLPAGAITEDIAVVAREECLPQVLIPAVTNAVLDEKVDVARNESSFASEQFRSLKIQLRHGESKILRKVLTVSSPDLGDGKSLVSVNLAFSFAEDPGCRILIIDCDLRRPMLNRYLGVTIEPGLLQYLSTGPLKPHCFMRRIDNLYFMTAGGIAPNAIEALSMRRMKELIEELRTQFDTIILDAPPFSPIADARVVTALSDGLIMVLRSGKTACSTTDRAFNMIDRKKLLGVVLNDVKAMPFQTYHYHDYYQYGGRRQVYPANAKRGKGWKKLLGA